MRACSRAASQPRQAPKATALTRTLAMELNPDFEIKDFNPAEDSLWNGAQLPRSHLRVAAIASDASVVAFWRKGDTANVVYVSRRLGHASPDITLRVYAQAPFPLAFFVLKARSGPAINSPLFAFDYGATLSDLLTLLAPAKAPP
jgi:hypothetical protein